VLAAPDDDVPRKSVVRGRMVDTEVDAAALCADKRAPRDQPDERVRRANSRSSPRAPRLEPTCSESPLPTTTTSRPLNLVFSLKSIT
jgi:hypothetical protein